MKSYHFVEVIRAGRISREGVELLSADANEFMSKKLFRCNFLERINDEYIFYLRGACWKFRSLTIVKRKEAVEFFKTLVVFGDDNVKQFVLRRPKFNTHGDLEVI